MKVEIKHRHTDAVLYAAEVPDDTPSGLAMRAALERATRAGANLAGANLRGANLDGANLDGAYLRSANLDGANLRGANLRGAYLRGANLRGANLRGAYLRGAYLRGAYLRGAYLAGANLDGAYLDGANLDGANLAGANLDGAKLTDSLTLVGERPLLQIGPIGSRRDTLSAYITDCGVYVRAGCFFDTRDQFVAAVDAEHGGNTHGDEYHAALVLIDAHARLWTPADETAEAA